MHEYKTKINENGRLVIPAAYRKALDIEPGDEVILRLENDELHISNKRHALARARKLIEQYIKPDENLTESLISDRRKEVVRD